jgi:transposase
MPPTTILGIDIAKDTFQVTLLQAGQPSAGNFPNTRPGFKQLSAWLKKRKACAVWACLEATGRYGEDLAEYLYAQGRTVSVVNPLAIKRYAESRLTRNKTDAVDAALIADFCATQQPPVWSPPAPEIRELRELLHQYDSLQASRQQAHNRLTSGFQSATVLAQLQAQIDFLDQQLAEIEQQINEHIGAHPELNRQHELLDSIPGVGRLTAARLLAEDLSRFEDARGLAAYAGVTPMNRTSGSSVRRRPKLCKIGKASLRRALYFPALAATRKPVFGALYQRLLAKGKSKMAALGAVMHKLLRIAYGVLKSGQAYDPHYDAQFHFAS